MTHYTTTPTQARAVKLCGYCKSKPCRTDSNFCSDACQRKRQHYSRIQNDKQHATLIGTLTRPICPVCGHAIGVWLDCECPATP
jgi:hypothetical protein